MGPATVTRPSADAAQRDAGAAGGEALGLLSRPRNGVEAKAPSSPTPWATYARPVTALRASRHRHQRPVDADDRGLAAQGHGQLQLGPEQVQHRPDPLFAAGGEAPQI